MPMSPYLRNVRQKVGHDLLLMPSVTIIAFDEQGRVLLVKHVEGKWVAPGGSIDPHERPADAAVREMWEETGLLIEPVRILGVYGGPEFHIKYSNQDEVSYLMTVFEGRIRGGEAAPDDVETLQLGYFSQADLATLDVMPWVRIVLADVFRDRTWCHFAPPTMTRHACVATNQEDDNESRG